MELELIKINVEIEGLADLMFDRFIDHSKTARPADQKLYLGEKNLVVMPSENIFAFLYNEDPAGCAKTFEGKKSKPFIRVGMGHTIIEPFHIPILHKGKEVKFTAFDKQKDIWWIFLQGGRTKGTGGKSIKQEASPRPVMRLPWSIAFQITLIKNDYIDETKLFNWFTMGGLQIGMGNYRPRFGRFMVKSFDKVD